MRRCVRCVMDTSDPNIGFDSNGVCNHCTRAELLLRSLPQTDVEVDARLDRLRERVLGASRCGGYDCVIGMSGGIDSAYVALLASRLGLRALAVHFDNGWNSEVAVGNIEAACTKLGFDLETYVVNWNEFRDLQRSFLRASVIDIELVTDHAIFAVMHRLAKDRGVKFVLSGTNIATESVMPDAWVWPKQDWRNIRAIQKRFGTVPLMTFPHDSILTFGMMRALNLGCTYVQILNNIHYRRDLAERELSEELAWRDYGEKHHESIFTRFYQCAILPTKFGVDKRKAHLSSRIVNGELSREEALAELASPACGPDLLAEDREYVLKKLGFSSSEFDAIMAAPPRPHDDYPSLGRLLHWLRRRRDLVREARLTT
ncbi:MAG: N-acetyl sugar amidotransferase [Microthrixaceae bacterium]|nr:N-acetyl sugar amidotransferase [Microthrixaceae bacterium]